VSDAGVVGQGVADTTQVDAERAHDKHRIALPQQRRGGQRGLARVDDVGRARLKTERPWSRPEDAP